MFVEVVEAFKVGPYTVEICRTDDEFDEYNPRDRPANIATIATWHRTYCLGDEQIPRGQFESMTEMVASFGRLVALQPVYFFEHGIIRLSSEPFNDPWDSGQVGWAFIRADDAARLAITDWTPLELNAAVKREIDLYGSYIDGDIFRYTIKDGSGVVEQVDGFLDLQQCREAAVMAVEEVHGSCADCEPLTA